MACQTTAVNVGFTAEIKMKHRKPLPFSLLKPVDGQTLEKIPLTLEISLYRGDKQTFAESSRTTQKVKNAVTYKAVDILRLVNVYKTTFPYRLEIGLTDRIPLLFHIFHIY